MPVCVRDLIEERNVLILHCMSPITARDRGATVEGSERRLKNRIIHNNNNLENNDFFLSCLAFNLGQDIVNHYEPGHGLVGHLFSMTGLIISDGLITHAGDHDLGFTENTNLNEYNDFLVNSLEDFNDNIFNPGREGHNELRIINPRYRNLFTFGDSTYNYSFPELILSSYEFNLPLISLFNNNINDIQFYNNMPNLITLENLINNHILH